MLDHDCALIFWIIHDQLLNLDGEMMLCLCNVHVQALRPGQAPHIHSSGPWEILIHERTGHCNL